MIGVSHTTVRWARIALQPPVCEEPIPCRACGTMTSPVRSQGRRGAYCSQACAAKARWIAAGYESPETVARRFWAKVDKDGPKPSHRPELGPCWIWTSTSIPGGYGQFWLNGKYERAAYVALLLTPGTDLSGGPFTCHHCDNPPCVNPGHLFSGTPLDNMRDMVAKGRDTGSKRRARLEQTA